MIDTFGQLARPPAHLMEEFINSPRMAAKAGPRRNWIPLSSPLWSRVPAPPGFSARTYIFTSHERSGRMAWV